MNKERQRNQRIIAMGCAIILAFTTVPITNNIDLFKSLSKTGNILLGLALYLLWFCVVRGIQKLYTNFHETKD